MIILQGLSSFRKVSDFIQGFSDFIQGFSKFWRWARRLPTLQFSTLVEVRLLIVRLSVRYHFSRKTVPTILPKLCMKVQHDKNRKRTRPFVRENSYSLIIHENVLKNGLFWGFSTLVGFWRKTALRNFLKALCYDRTAFFWQPRENRMSRKILVDFWDFFSCDA